VCGCVCVCVDDTLFPDVNALEGVYFAMKVFGHLIHRDFI